MKDSKPASIFALLIGATLAIAVLIGAVTNGMGLWTRGGAEEGRPPDRIDVPQRSGSDTSGQRAGQPNRPSAPDPLPPARWRWWTDAAVQHEVGLSTQQVARLEAIVKEREVALAPFIAEWRAQSEVLNRMARERKVSIEEFSIQAAHVDSLATKLTESRTVMLYRMSRELNDEQYRKLQEVRDRRSRGGGRSSSPNR